MFLVRLAHPFYARTLEFIFGADRTRITRWTNAALDWFFDSFNHLLELNVARLTEKAHVYAEAIGRKMEYPDPSACRSLFFVDGVFVCVGMGVCVWYNHSTPPVSSHPSLTHDTPIHARTHAITPTPGTCASPASSRTSTTPVRSHHPNPPPPSYCPYRPPLH